MPHIFISYSRKNQPYVLGILALLAVIVIAAIVLSSLNRSGTPAPVIAGVTTPDLTRTLDAKVTSILATNIAEETATATLFTPTPTLTHTPTSTPEATYTPPPTPTLSPEQIVLTPVTSNASWTPVERDFDGVTMVLVPVGCFMMGSDNGYDDEKPVHEQCFSEPFWIDRTEVTQADFARLGGQKANPNYFTGDNLPVDSITWFEARDFCEQRGMRLPTEAEWEYAARGPNSLEYPWGNIWNGNNIVWNHSSSRRTANVGSIPAGISWVGALDMSGNVWEWVSSLYQDYPYSDDQASNNSSVRVLRGGSWLDVLIVLFRAANRSGNIPINWDIDDGFRCASS
ncbi:MAG: formylglycine-generating enzyme family protein [Anaerolineae bacterium]|nr:formylglycine-generating enzyme family protein [Anaerolineae bacterium]